MYQATTKGSKCIGTGIKRSEFSKTIALGRCKMTMISTIKTKPERRNFILTLPLAGCNQ